MNDARGRGSAARRIRQNIRQATDDNQKNPDGLLDGKDLASGRGYNSFWIDPGIKLLAE